MAYSPSLRALEGTQQIAAAPYRPSLSSVQDMIPKDDAEESTMDKMKGIAKYVATQPMRAGIDTVNNIMKSVEGGPKAMARNLAFMGAGAALPEVGIPERLISNFMPRAAVGLANGGLRATTASALGGAENAMQQGDTSKDGMIKNATEGFKRTLPMALTVEGGMTIPKMIGGISQWIHPSTYAGKMAEQIRQQGQKGLAQGEKQYAPVHDKYDDRLMTIDPKKYLGFAPEDTQYFKPDVNRSYRDFLAEPTFANLHALQSKMGAYNELRPMREEIKDKIFNFLSKDPQMLARYQKGSDIMRDKYYPYIATDTTKNIVQTKKPILRHDPEELHKALQESPLIQKSAKAEEPIKHPLVKMGKQLDRRMNAAALAKYVIPIMTGGAASAMGGSSSLGMLGGMTGGAVAGHMGGLAASKAAQNPLLESLLKNASRGVYGALPFAGSGS